MTPAPTTVVPVSDSATPVPDAASTSTAPSAFDPDRHWRLHDRVALRPEPFGAMAYHYGNRRLTFLRSPDLVALVEHLADQPSARAAFDAVGIEPRRWPSFEKALASLVAGQFLVPDEDPQASADLAASPDLPAPADLAAPADLPAPVDTAADAQHPEEPS